MTNLFKKLTKRHLVFFCAPAALIVLSSVIIAIGYNVSGSGRHNTTASASTHAKTVAGIKPSATSTNAVLSFDPPGIGFATFASVAAQLPDPFAPCSPPAANAIACDNPKPVNPASARDMCE